MAGACPQYGSGGYVSSRSVSTTVTHVPKKMAVKRSKEEEEMLARRFRDEYYRFWETSF
jgi:hypothetical protein